MAGSSGRECDVIGKLVLDLALTGEEAKTEKIAESLSGIAWHGSCAFLGSDEGPGLERLEALESGGSRYGRRREFPLQPLFGLEGGPRKEADIESVAVDGAWLCLVTSHALTRGKLEDGPGALAKVERHRRRYVLGRVPLAPGEQGLPVPSSVDGERRARSVPQTDGGSALTDALIQDPHLGRSLQLPAKENGLDIEGLAVVGDRVVLGLRGPVLRGQWAVLLDLEWCEGDGGNGMPLAERDGTLYRKIFLNLDGLGIRDLCRRGNDLLILAGPTMPVRAPYRLYVAPDFFRSEDPPEILDGDRLEYLCDLPLVGGNPEGISIYPRDVGGKLLAMVVDGADAEQRTQARALLIRAP